MSDHMMLDLETLSTSNRAALLQVGIAVFDPLGDCVTHSCEWNVDVSSCVAMGGEVDDGAIRFWLLQPDAARRVVAADPVMTISHVLADMERWYHGCTAAWSNGAAFDLSIMEFYFRAQSIRCPWSHRAQRDTRTLWALARDMGWQRPERGPTAHTAMADAVAQALDVQSAWRYIANAPACAALAALPEGAPAGLDL